LFGLRELLDLLNILFHQLLGELPIRLLNCLWKSRPLEQKRNLLSELG
jgi:hypothetical protein